MDSAACRESRLSRASFSRRSDSISSSSEPTRSSVSIGVVLSLAATASCARKRSRTTLSAPRPLTASMRRMPVPMLDSPSTNTEPSSPV